MAHSANDDHGRAPARVVVDAVVEAMQIDDVDRQLVDMLRADGRTSNRAMSTVVGLKEAAVATRVRSLAERQVLAVSALIDWDRAGYRWDAWLYLDVEGRSATDVADDLAAYENVVWVHAVFGAADIIAHVLLTDRTALADFLARDLAKIAGLRNVRCLMSLETFKFDVQFADLPIVAAPVRFPAHVIATDELDEEIAFAFMRDGRQSIRQAARDLGVSESAVRVRLARLEEAGLIRMCAQIDPVRTNMLHAWAYIGIDVIDVDKRGVCRELASIPEILVVILVGGDHDILVLAAAGNRGALLDIASSKIRRIPGVHRTRTSDIAKVVKLDYRWARLAPVPDTCMRDAPLPPSP